MKNTLRELEQANLIKISEKKSGRYELRVKESLLKVQAAFELSLSMLARTDPSLRRVVEPLFETNQDQRYSNDIFVLMPLAKEFDVVYQDFLKKVAGELELKIGRADDFFTTRNIMSEIWSAIWHSKVIVADCTGRNPNVFYEIGLAHAIGKQVVLLAQKGEDIPFDLRHLRFILYSLEDRAITAFEWQLRNVLTWALGEHSFRALPPKRTSAVIETNT